MSCKVRKLGSGLPRFSGVASQTLSKPRLPIKWGDSVSSKRKISCLSLWSQAMLNCGGGSSPWDFGGVGHQMPRRWENLAENTYEAPGIGLVPKQEPEEQQLPCPTPQTPGDILPPPALPDMAAP